MLPIKIGLVSKSESIDFPSLVRAAVVANRGDAAKVTAGLANQDVREVLSTYLAQFARPGVYSVRPGWRFGPSGITGERAIVVTVVPEKQAALANSLPSTVQGVPVDVRAATPLQQLRALSPAEYLSIGAARHELRQPDFKNEVFFDEAGKPSAPIAPLAAFDAGLSAKKEIDYRPAPGVTLEAVTAPISMILHASPDAGWEQLSRFLAGVRQELVVGMYEFTSAHILHAVTNAVGGGKRLTLTLDHPAPNPSRDQTDEETVTALATSLGGDFQEAWALTNSDRMATAWIYPNAYHLKVAVRDDGTFWLSSGNWNNSNQPHIDLSDATAARAIAASHDRDWHVIASSPRLADTFRAFLQNDFTIARENNVDTATTAPGMAATEAMVPESVLAAGRAPRKLFPAKIVFGTIKIQPLLTPDNYQPHVLSLIESATTKFYMQTQYIHPSECEGDEQHDALIAAVKGRIDAGVDVRLITSQFQTNDWVEKLVDAGIPGTVLRRQANVHNKGIVVDGIIAMVSSQNWSADGTLRNRDAGLIIHSAEAAAYFEEIFLHDWDNLAAPVAAS